MAEEKYDVCLYNESHARALSLFSKRVWPQGALENFRRNTAGEVVTKIPASTDQEEKEPLFIFLKDEEIIGHIATKSIRLHCGSRLLGACWMVGFMVIPEYRDGLIGPLLIKKVNETLDLAMTLHVEQAALRVFTGLGWKHIGVIPQYVTILKPHRLLKSIRIGQFSFLRKRLSVELGWVQWIISNKLSRFVLGVLLSTLFNTLNLGAVLLRPRKCAGTLTEENGFDETYNQLWEKVKDKFGALVVRDKAYLKGRYGANIEKYRILTLRKKGELLGYCILKIKNYEEDPRMGNARMGTIVDCLFDPENLSVFQSLLDAALILFKKEKVDAIFCSASQSKVQKLLLLNGYIRIPGNLHFAYYDRLNQIPENLNLDSWHLMRGDSDADQNM